ncbi:MAG: hypothetical protein ACREM9_08345 [Gemmatimonadales bacterium]
MSAAAGIVAGLFVLILYAQQRPDVISDWDPTWVGTRALLRGESPYAAIQVPPWPNWLLYPLPAMLVTAPFTYVPLPLARGIFAAIGTVAFTWVITRRHRWTLYFLLSGAMLWSWIVVQWAPLLIASALTPALSWLLAVKPTLGFALWTGWPNRMAVIGGIVFVGLSLLIRPGWIQEWLASVAKTPHEPHLLRPGGFLLLLGLLRWRRGEGRLLAVLSLVPQTTALYETLPLALLCRNRPQAAGFASLTMLAHLIFLLGPQGPWPVGAEYQWWVLLMLVYLPAIVLVLRRKNDAEPDPGAI